MDTKYNQLQQQKTPIIKVMHQCIICIYILQKVTSMTYVPSDQCWYLKMRPQDSVKCCLTESTLFSQLSVPEIRKDKWRHKTSVHWFRVWCFVPIGLLIIWRSWQIQIWPAVVLLTQHSTGWAQKFTVSQPDPKRHWRGEKKPIIALLSHWASLSVPTLHGWRHLVGLCPLILFVGLQLNPDLSGTTHCSTSTSSDTSALFIIQAKPLC